jgi:CheY-like chemotaxis protein
MADQYQILVVDDDEEDRLILLDYLTDSGLSDKVHFVENGEKAIQYLESIKHPKHLPQVVVLDLNMPVLNGTETLRRMKSSPPLTNIPVIIFTTSENPLEKKKCCDLGAVAYLIKPTNYKQGKIICEKLSSFIKD